MNNTQHTPRNWLPCGNGTLAHPVSGRPITTHVIEAEGWGRIGEWYDYSNETEANFALIVSAPALLEMLERLRNIVTP